MSPQIHLYFRCAATAVLIPISSFSQENVPKTAQDKVTPPAESKSTAEASAPAATGKEEPAKTAPEGGKPAGEVPVKPVLVTEKELLGTYLQLQSGAIMDYQPGGKMVGFPVGGTYKVVEPGTVELFSRKPDGGEERTRLYMIKMPGGLAAYRDVNGEPEETYLQELKPVPLEADKWQGPAVLHLLQAEDKRATKRQVTIDKEGYFRTKEGGYYFRLMKTEAGLTLAYSTEESHSSVPVQIRRSGPMLVIYDSLEKPKLLAIVQLDARVEEKRPGAEKP